MVQQNRRPKWNPGPSVVDPYLAAKSNARSRGSCSFGKVQARRFVWVALLLLLLCYGPVCEVCLCGIVSELGEEAALSSGEEVVFHPFFSSYSPAQTNGRTISLVCCLLSSSKGGRSAWGKCRFLVGRRVEMEHPCVYLYSIYSTYRDDVCWICCCCMSISTVCLIYREWHLLQLFSSHRKDQSHNSQTNTHARDNKE